MRLSWPIALTVFVALIWIGCTSTGQPGIEKAGQEVVPTQGEVASPVPTGEKLANLSATATLAREATPSPTVVEASPTTRAVSTPTTPAQPADVKPTPTTPPVATLPATAEGPDQETTAPARATTQESPAVQRPATQEYSPQPLPLHPFLPAGGRARVIAIDPGHGGPEVGAAGAGLAEKNVNLSIALRLRNLLQQDGIKVVMAREDDSRAVPPSGGRAAEGSSSTRQDLQARLDIANNAQADAFISIHNNGSGDPNQSGTEVWYDAKRPFGAFNAALAEDTLDSLVEFIRGAGYPTGNRGLKEDSQYRIFQGRAFPLFVLGPPRTGSSATRAGMMPAILGETLFLSNPAEAWQLTRDDMLTAIAAGYRQGLLRYFHRIDSGALAMPPGGLQPESPNYYVLTPNQGTGG